MSNDRIAQPAVMGHFVGQPRRGTVDAKIYALALARIEDVRPDPPEALVQDLAAHLQREADEWMAVHVPEGK